MMREPGKPGKKIDKSEVQPVEGELYDTSVLRTIFIDFGIEHWEEELELFHGTDVDVVANLTVDGKTYPNVGLRFRGASSYFMVPRGLKRSLNLSVDMADEKQSLQGYKTLNLLNCNGDASMFSSVLYSHIARKYMPAPKANFVRVVINGENWGVFANVEQFNKDFLKHHYGNSKGTRWKVSGSPQGRGGLEYFGGDEEQYKRHFEMKSDDPDSWKDLIHFCKVLNETPPEKLKEAISPLLDLDEALWFLALDNALVNSDGYWVRASDYSLYLDDKKVFHVIPHDMNEAFRPARGPGMGRPGGPGGPGGPSGLGGFGRGGSRPNGQMGRGPEARRAEPSQAEGRERPESERPQSDRPQRPPAENQEDESSDRSRRPNRQANPDTAPTQLRRPGGPGGLGGGQVSDLDPLVGLNSPRMPLRSKLLAVPELREQYLKNVKQIASESLTWSELGPIVETVGKTIEPHVKEDTRKLTTYEAFATAALSKESSLRKFIEGRSKYLLEYQPKK
jgi:spore coat protein CotH